MRRTMVGVLMAVCCAAAAPALSHHAFSAEFDVENPIKLTGSITRVLWSNPHAWVYVDVKGADGTVVNWGLEAGAANALYRRGWRPQDVPVGAMVTIEAFPARNGTPRANAGKILLADGRELFAGSPTAAPAGAPEGAPR